MTMLLHDKPMTGALQKTARAGLLRSLRRVFTRAARLVRQAAAASAEARAHEARLEAELYRYHYRLTSKNDDDLPVVR